MQHHTMSQPDAEPEQAIHEIARVAIALPDNTTFYNDPRYIAVAFDAVADKITHSVLGASTYLPYLARYDIFSRLCGERAMRTVDRLLLVNGETITPEGYLGLWRTVVAHPLTVAQFTDRYGYEVVAVLGGLLDELRDKRSSWSSSPFKTFDDFELVYRDQIAYLDDGQRFRLELDLRQENAARDAFYGEAFLSSSKDSGNAIASIVLKAVDPSRVSATASAAQPDLFPMMAEAV